MTAEEAVEKLERNLKSEDGTFYEEYYSEVLRINLEDAKYIENKYITDVDMKFPLP